MIRSPRWILSGALAAGVVCSAVAQQPTRIRGTIERMDGSILLVRTGEGREVKLGLAEKLQIYGVVNGSLADVKPGAFIGVGALPQPDGSQKAIQVTIFAEALRGLGEGHRPWDRPGATMTNGTVDSTVVGVEGQVLTVRYKDGVQKIVVPPGAVVRAYVDGARDELKPGAHIATSAVQKSDGTLEAARINVGRAGIVPQ